MEIGVDVGVWPGCDETRESLFPCFRCRANVVCRDTKIDFAAVVGGGRHMGSTAPFEAVPASGSMSRDAVGLATVEAAVRYPRRPAARAALKIPDDIAVAAEQAVFSRTATRRSPA